MAGFDFDKVKMNVVKTASSGVVNKETIFAFRQAGDIVWASYEGGAVIKGFLVGKLDNSTLTFRYCQTDKSGNIDGGVSTCQVERMAGNRLRLIEQFAWESRGETGENIFEELS